MNKNFCALLIAIALFVSAAAYTEICRFGMIKNTEGYSMRLQCNEDEPINLDRCGIREVILSQGKVSKFVTCCNAERDLCVTVVVPTNKVGM